MDNARLPLNATICCYQYITVANSVGHYGCTRFCINFGLGLYGRIQGVQNPEAFIKIFMQRLFNCHSQNWQEHVSNSTRFSIHRMFKTSISLEPYFTSVTNKHIRGHLDIIQNWCIQYSCTQNEVRNTHTSRSVVSSITLPTKMKCISYFIANH